MLLFGVIPSIFFCFWLILLYKNICGQSRFAELLLSGAGDCRCGSQLLFYRRFCLQQGAHGARNPSFLSAVYFCILVLADNIGLPLKVIFGATAVNMLINAVVFLRNLSSPGAYKSLMRVLTCHDDTREQKCTG